MDVIKEYWSYPLIGSAADGITLGGLVLSVAFMVVLVVVLRWLRRRFVPIISKRLGADQGTVHSFVLIANYVIGLISFIVLMQMSGVNLSALTVVFGALSVGIGFGLQNIVNNFVCGVVLLIERPVKIGDRVVVDNFEGDIVDISMRSTTLRTNEGVSVVVPNAHFITSTVVNRSLEDHRIRLKIPVNVAYGTDPEHVRRVLTKVALSHPGTMHTPEPVVVFDEFGTNSLHFFLWVWTQQYTHRPTMFRSDLNYRIHEAFAEEGIVTPFPQLEVRLKSEHP